MQAIQRAGGQISHPRTRYQKSCESALVEKSHERIEMETRAGRAPASGTWRYNNNKSFIKRLSVQHMIHGMNNLTLDGVVVSFPILRRELPARLIVGGFEKVIVCRRVSGIAHNNWHRMSTYTEHTQNGIPC
jgi:hypothetical protein